MSSEADPENAAENAANSRASSSTAQANASPASSPNTLEPFVDPTAHELNPRIESAESNAVHAGFGPLLARMRVFVRRRIGLILAGALLLPLPLGFAFDELFARGLPHGTRLLGLDLSHTDFAQARRTLRTRADELAQRPLRIALGDKTLTRTPSELGLSLDVDASLERVRHEARGRGFARRFAFWVGGLLVRHAQAPALVRSDDERTQRELSNIERANLELPSDGGFHLERGRVIADAPHAGRRIERVSALANAENALAFAHDSVGFTTVVAQPLTDRDAVVRLVAKVSELSASDVTLASADSTRKLVVRASELAAALRGEPKRAAPPVISLDSETLERELAARFAELENAAKSARFSVDSAEHITLIPSESEVRVARTALPGALLAAAASPDKLGALPLERGAEPALTTADAEALSIHNKVSSFTTRHPCCEHRVDNIHRIADMLDGFLVKPGETISVNAVIGPRTAKNGFVPAPTIEEGEMVETIGGGISQFATTMFNALFYGGYDIVERQPHTYWFTRYPMGHEATLSYPKPDLIFRNDTQAGMLIHTSYTKTSITVSIFGDNGGRKVEAQVSARQNIVKPPLEIIPNPSISPDKEHTLQGGMIGWSVMVGRIIHFPDGTQKEERRKVTYKPKARRVEVHPCRVPEGEKGYTGEPCPEPKDSGDGASAASP